MDNSSSFHSKRAFDFDQVLLALLLTLGLYFPTSTDGEHSPLCITAAFAFLMVLLCTIAWRFGPRPGAVVHVAIPLLIVLSLCTLRSLFGVVTQFDIGSAKFVGLALLLSLNLRRVYIGRWVEGLFTAANLVNITCGVAILIGSDWIVEFLPRFYWSIYTELVPHMMSLHKPVLTLGTHASAAFFFYLFFWVNWETYRERRSKRALIFAFSYIVLLFGLTSFSSLGFGSLALLQVGAGLWKRDRRLAIASALSTAIAVSTLVYFAEQYIDIGELPQLALGSTFLNSETSGPLARYGSHGGSMPPIKYLLDNPLSPIGLTTFPVTARDPDSGVGDAGQVEYLLRGSVPLLALIYVGLYRFLRCNLTSPSHALLFFVVIVGFESAFSVLVYFRTLYLLPFFIVYLNTVANPNRAAGELVSGSLSAA